MGYTNACFEAAIHREPRSGSHAIKRSQQRGIGQECVPLILAYGERSHDGRGGIRYLLTKRAIANLELAVGRSQRLDQLKGCYAVVSADDEKRIITMGHRYS